MPIGKPENNRFEVQDSAYSFPYHYLTDISYLPQEGISIHRSLTWGFEYMTYMTWVLQHVRNLQPNSLLDVGCGDGRLLNLLAKDVPIRSGVDLSDRAIAFAKAFNPDVTFFNTIDDTPNGFDVITCIETLEHIPDDMVSGFLALIQRKLKSGRGKFILSVPTVAVSLNRKHYRHYTLELLEKHLSPSFIIEEAEFLFKDGNVTRIIDWLLCNRFYVLAHVKLRHLIWRAHRRFSYVASPKDGRHLVVICRGAARC